MSELPQPTIKSILKAVFWNRWGAIVGAILAVFGILDFIDAHFASRFPATLKSLWGSYYVLPSLSRPVWIAVIAVSLAIIALHGAYVFAMDYSKRYQQLMKNKVVFELDEISTRVFITTDPALIIARLKLRFHNKEPYDEYLKTIKLTLHDLAKSDEIMTWILNDQYFGFNGSNEVEIPRDGFEGMLIQGKRLTPWYLCAITIHPASDEKLEIPGGLTGAHYLAATIDVTNQELYKTRIFVNWEKACDKNGTAVLSYGAPAIRRFEDRRLSEKTN